ncbi:VOC family protein [Aureimonas sp. AU4]|uniref:VOC family protein n=1 Tax=Aureimonas sp. AU4 TaxID=1638163 RepID=UPI000780B4C1|nr:VOC family protein [Aureimonas sp. AU4]
MVCRRVTSIGHVHLRVGDLAAATRFYRDVIGLDLMVQLPSASFLSSGGYHHHIAVNVWHSRGSGYRSNDEAGLAEVELHARDRAAVENAFERALEAGLGPVHADAGFRVADPSGNRIRIARDD